MLPMKRRHIFLAFAVMGSLGLVYFSTSPGTYRTIVAAVASLGTDARPSVRIGAAIGLTGMCAQWGEDERKAEQLAADEANKRGGIDGRRIVLIIEDTQCTPKGTVNAIKKLLDVDRVALILGPTWGDSFQGGTVITEDAHVVSISPSTAMEALFYNKQPIGYTFSTWFPEKSEIDVLQRYAAKLNIRTFIVLHDQDPFASMMADLFTTQAASHSLHITNKYALPVAADDYRSVILKLKKEKPEAIFISFEGSAAKARFLKQARELGLSMRVFSSSDIEDGSLIEQFGSVMDGIIYTRPEVTGDTKAFKEAFRGRYGTNPTGQSAANAYDATRTALKALEQSRQQNIDLKSAVEQINLPGTAVPEIKFNSLHQLEGTKFQIKTIRDGEFVAVDERL